MTDKNAMLTIEGHDDAVVITFNDRKAILPPDQAVEIAQELMKKAGSVKYGGETLAKKHAEETIRQKLIPRVMHIIRSMQEKQKAPQFIANEVVDKVLGEIL